MIGWLAGVVRDKRPPQLILEVHGVGYEVEAPMTTFYTLPDAGESATLHIHQVVREDAQLLYGFSRREERDLFRMLLKISGVGAKLALAILSGMDTAGFSRCVFEGDAASLARLPGIGKKTAERLIIEMRDRLDGTAPGGAGAIAGGAAVIASDPVSEAVGALVALGFKPAEASRRVRAVESPGLACEDLVRQALKALAR